MAVGTTLAIAQSCLSIYQMTRSKPGGIGDLLHAQTEMLKQIHNQITTLSKVTQQIYLDTSWIKEKLHLIPSETARSVYSLGGKASIIRAGELFDEYMIDVSSSGREIALNSITSRAERVLSELQQNRSALSSILEAESIPIMSAMWDAELYILLNCVEFDQSRVLVAARLYRKWFESCSEHKILPIINEGNGFIEAEFLNLNNKISANSKLRCSKKSDRPGHINCVSSSNGRGQSMSCGGNVFLDNYSYTYSPVKLSNEWKSIFSIIKDIISYGAPLNDRHRTIPIIKWGYNLVNTTSVPVQFDTPPNDNLIDRVLSQRHNMCLDTFIKSENDYIHKIYPHLERMCLFGNLFLVARETAASITKIERELEENPIALE